MSPEVIDFAECISSAMIVELAKVEEQNQLNQHLRDELIHNIVFNNMDHVDAVGQVWDWNFSLHHSVLIVDGVVKEYNRSLREKRSLIEEFLVLQYNGIATGIVGDVFIALCPVTSESGFYLQGEGNWKDTVKEAFVKLQREFPDIEFWGGVGKLYRDSSSLYRSFQEAKVALQLVQVLGNKSQLAFFDELGAIRLFYNQREQDLKEYFQEILGAVQKYDSQRDSDLLLTLWTYYMIGEDLAPTAAKLHIHVNTLRYRLRKVEELVGVKLDQQETRFNIYAALKVGIMLGVFHLDPLEPGVRFHKEGEGD